MVIIHFWFMEIKKEESPTVLSNVEKRTFFFLSFIYLLKNVCTKRRLVVDELVGLVVPAVELSDFLTDLL